MNTLTKTISLRFLSLTFLMVISLGAFAQDEEGGLSFSGSVDTYFRYNLNGSNTGTDTLSTLAPSTSFAKLPGFSLGMVNLIASYDGEKTGFVADLVWGPRGNEAVFGSLPFLGSSDVVNQLYVYWNVSDKVTLTLGNFNTFLGYEVISPTANFNYSTSYMFSYGPFSHTGLKANFDLGGGLTAMAAIMNPTDYTEYNPFNDYYGGLQVGYTNDMGGAWVNAIIADGFYQVDLTTGWDLTDAVYVGLNATTAQDAFSGAALYLQLATSDALAFGVRGEYFSNDQSPAILADESVIDVTVSANYTVGGLTLIPEFRLDALSYDGYVYSDDPTDVGSSLSSFALAAVYAF